MHLQTHAYLPTHTRLYVIIFRCLYGSVSTYLHTIVPTNLHTYNLLSLDMPKLHRPTYLHTLLLPTYYLAIYRYVPGDLSACIPIYMPA